MVAHSNRNIGFCSKNMFGIEFVWGQHSIDSFMNFEILGYLLPMIPALMILKSHFPNFR